MYDYSEEAAEQADRQFGEGWEILADPDRFPSESDFGTDFDATDWTEDYDLQAFEAYRERHLP